MAKEIFCASGVTKHFVGHQSLVKKLRKVEPFVVRAVDGVDFTINEGETIGLVGESGCGKSTLGRTMVGLYPLTSGTIEMFGQKVDENRTLEQRRAIQMIFQDPFSSLNPQMTIRSMLEEILLFHKLETKATVENRIKELLTLVGLPLTAMDSHPRQFSGGQRQRIGIARALALNPKILIADEAVSALDVSVQATIVNLLLDLKRDLGLTMVFISHNIAVVRQISDRIAVMYLGRIVEMGPTEQVFKDPKHPYTKVLLESIPRMTPGSQLTTVVTGEAMDAQSSRVGCRFRNRCSSAMSACATTDPTLLTVGTNHQAACLLYNK